MNIPNAEALHDHINKMMEGKLGCLAKEIAEETAEDLNIDMEDVTSINDVFNKLFKNPTKLKVSSVNPQYFFLSKCPDRTSKTASTSGETCKQ